MLDASKSGKFFIMIYNDRYRLKHNSLSLFPDCQGFRVNYFLIFSHKYRAMTVDGR